jgi:Spy/CpxP family protein refolding chaperone
MKRLTWVLCGTAVLGLVLSPARGQAKAGKAADKGLKSTRAIVARYDTTAGEIPIGQWLALMTKECKLSEAVQAQVKEKIDALNTATSTWDKENADKLVAARDEMKKARASQDKDAAKRAGDSLRALVDARAQLRADKEGDVLSLLSPEQRQEWESYKLFHLATGTFKSAGLTDEQLPQIRALCDAAAKQLIAAQDDATRRQIRATLLDDCKAKILTDAQREKVKDLPSPGKDRLGKTAGVVDKPRKNKPGKGL